MNSSARKKRNRTKEQQEFMDRFHRELERRPEISDEDFMKETEVSDEEYKRGFILPGPPARK